MTEVAIVQRVIPHYRVPFFEQLRVRLGEDGINLRVLGGQPTDTERAKQDSGTLPWAEQVHNRYLPIRPRNLVWQPCLRSLISADLVIFEHASRLLVNYPLLAWRSFGGPKVAFWGHGRNFDQAAASPLAEWVKRQTATRADWWFCYTERSARVVDSLGVPEDRRTVVQNAVDTSGIRAIRELVTADDLAELRDDICIGSGPVAVSIGSIYPAKRPEYLVEVADTIKAELPSFELVVIGDGPSRSVIDGAAATRPWVHPVGALTGSDMVRHAALGSVMLNPGLVGLAVLDAFALGLPVVTCDLPLHSPEIGYLVDGENGAILPRHTSPKAFGEYVAGLLRDDDARGRLQDSAAQAANSYTIEAMATHFARGVRSALSSSADDLSTAN